MPKKDKLSKVKYKMRLQPDANLVNLSALYFPSAPGYTKNITVNVNNYDHSNRYSDRVGYLTPKDIDIMQFVANGLTALQIAGKLSVSNRTIEHRILDLRRKLSCKTITELAVILLRAHIIK